MAKIRLDVLLCEKGLAESREKAKAMIMSGVVFIGDVRHDKPGMSVPEDAEVEVRGSTLEYVSRGGLKLEKALKYFGVSPEGMTCIDCGASTGGFTDVLLKNGAAKVYAIDVGYGQLAWKIRSDERVVVMERTNIRHVTKEQVPDEPDLAVIDVSFISLKLVLPVIKTLLSEKGQVVCLVKPQFEAGKENVGKKGVVRDRSIHKQVLDNFLINAAEAGFNVLNMTFSPIRGPEGNIEYLGHLSLCEKGTAQIDTEELTRLSHQELDR